MIVQWFGSVIQDVVIAVMDPSQVTAVITSVSAAAPDLRELNAM